MRPTPCSKMNSAKPLHLFGIAIIWTLTAVTALVNDPGCIYAHPFKIKRGFYVRFDSSDNVTITVTCNGTAYWPDFTDIGVNCNAIEQTDFVNCNFSESPSLLDTFHMMNLNYSGKINFNNLRSPLSRQYFRNISAVELSFENSYLDEFELPFDLLHDVLDLRTLKIHDVNLLRIPVNFFKDWSRNLQRVDIMGAKLQKITKDDFANLIQLRELILFRNGIAEIEAGAFDNLPNLEVLEISNNSLHTLPPGIFHHLSKLTTLHMGQNPFDQLPGDLLTGIDNTHLNKFSMNAICGSLKILPAGFFKNIASLKHVLLQGNQLESLPADLFSQTPELVNLNLKNNSLSSIPLGLFKGFEKLKTLGLGKNQITTLPAGIFATLIHLDSLDVSYNNLTTLTRDITRGLNALKTLNASHNQLNKVDEDFCDNLKSVESIDFSYNKLNFQGSGNYKYKDERPSIFLSCDKLYNIHLSNNEATKIFADYGVRQYDIDLRNNLLSELTVKDIEKLHPVGTKVDLRNNQISKINLTELPSAAARYKVLNKNLDSRSLSVMLGNNPLHCDCHLIDFVRYWKSELKSELRKYVKLTIDGSNEGDGSMTCASPAEFANRDIDRIDPEELSCPLTTDIAGDACNTTCTCREYPAKQVLTLDCSHRNLSQLPAMITNAHNWSIALNMSYNMLKESPSLTSNPYFANVSSLDLSNNNISSVSIDLFSKNLVDLKLHNNSISRLDEQVIKYLKANKAMRSITLHQNPWQCDCEAHNFFTFVQDKALAYRLNRVTCYGTNKKLYEMTMGDICKDAVAVIVGASLLVAFFSIVIGILAALYYKYQQEIKVWLYSKQCCLWFVTEDELDKDKKYDAFVSFSHKDENFVEKEIVAKLEDGPRPYKLCLHYRDWLAGEWIPVQISQSVEDSRRTIVVLSANFLESVWGRMEFRAAHTQALKEGRARVIIILYGEIENMDDLDPELKAYLSLNTYIKWGDPWFWDKLRYALPHRFEPSRRRTRNARMIEDHLIRQTANSDAGNAIVKSDVISMSKLANDSAKLLDPCLDDRMSASC